MFLKKNYKKKKINEVNDIDTFNNASITKKLPSKDDIVNILKKVKDPETEFSVFDLRLIKYIDYREQDKTLIINAAFRNRMPHCKACQFLSFKIIDTITHNLEKEFYKYSGIEKIEYIDI